ncbi:hypothetical protein OEZ85_004413 [Tetradesmus obliquus]|uniref:Uncharacterized protein n=1 Tax=Tetradesmus obliquus TaxID=3088 RepID=A0ABY8UR82_TETOB|nr:hypothetical protein OEZ85_004413 [Tetradesmus obliquus]
MAPKLALLLLLAAALPAAISACNSCCTVASLKVAKAGEAAKPQESGAYGMTDVQSHFFQVDENPYVKNTEATFACVDARGDNPYLMTPGGDYAELSDGIYVFANITGIRLNATVIGHLFRNFVQKVASPKRPFYFHTDETKLASLFSAVNNAGIKPKPVVFPAVMPSDPKAAAIWLSYLSKAEYQGCGHVRLMLYKPQEYGLSSNYVPQELIKQFFSYWWPTPLGSPERKRIKFAIKRGPLQGKAVAIVNNEGPGCQGYSPKSFAAHHGSSIFVYHQNAVAEFRAKVLAPFFAEMAKQTFFTGKPLQFNMAQFIKQSDALAGTQLGYTINNLYPADSVGLFSVNYATKFDSKLTDE